MSEAATASQQLETRAEVSVTVSEDKLSAFLLLSPPEDDAQELTETELIDELKKAGIVFGLLDEVLHDLAENQVYDEKILIARGTSPEPGKDAEIEYTFSTEQKRTPTQDSDGRIDYKNLEYFQNATAGQILARKTPPTEGSPGKTVFGEEIPVQPGRDKQIGKGANTSLSEDGLELKADIDGSIVFSNGVTNVLAVQTVSGNVDASTGNIDCNGSLKITKDVKSGFRVKVKGDLEVGGHVEDAEIECDGNVIVKKGFFGSSDTSGIINAGGDVTVKWIDGQDVHSEGILTIGGEAINCRLYGRKGIIIQGAKGKIAGGEAASRYLIQAPELGSEGGAATHLKVAFDPETLQQLKHVETELERINEDEHRVKEGMTELYKLQLIGNLPPEKEAVLRKLEDFLKSVPEKRTELEQKREVLLGKLKEIANAEIIAEQRVYPGAIVHFGVIYKEIVDERGPTRFYIENDIIIASEYLPSSD